MRLPRRLVRRARRKVWYAGKRHGRRWVRRHPLAAGALVAGLMPAGCLAWTAEASNDTRATVSSLVEQASVPSFTLPTIIAPPAPTSSPAGPAAPAFAQLQALVVNDAPKQPDRDKTRLPSETYNRDRDWQPNGWTDPDGNGCDAREDALIAASIPPLSCAGGRVVGQGRWPLAYVPGETTESRDLHVDHVVSLSEAWKSGAWRWAEGDPARGVERMRAFTQDAEELWAVHGPSNGARSDKTPDQWRPPLESAWCTLATRYVWVKTKYELTVTSRERDALGAMLGTCP